MDKEQMKQPPQPWEFRSKPAWQRLIIMLGGVTVNFILGILLWSMVLFVWGEQFLPANNATYGLAVDTLGMQLGLQDGDRIKSVGNTPFTKFEPGMVVGEIMINGATQMQVERNGSLQNIPISEDFSTNILPKAIQRGERLFALRIPAVIGEVAEDSPADKAGLSVGDSIVAVNGQAMRFNHEFVKIVRPQKSKEIEIGFYREGQQMSKTLTTTEGGTVGFYPQDNFKYDRQDYSLASSLPAGAKASYNFLADQIKAFGRMFSGKLSPNDSLGGFASIGKLFGDEWIWERFWKMTAILSLILGFMNLLPIPALDGGHVMFLLYEVVTGRKPSDRFMEIATIVGFVAVLALVLYANGLDVWRWLRG